MGALDEFLSGGQPETRDKAFKIAPKVQQERDQGRMQILQDELDKNKTDLNSPDVDTRRRAQSNIQMLQREIAAASGQKQSLKPAEVKQSTGLLDDFLNQSETTPAKQEAPIAKPKSASVPYMPPAQPEATTAQKLGRSAAGLADTVIGNIQALPGTALAEVGYAGVKGLEGLGLAKPGQAERGREEVYKRFVEP